MNLQTTKKSRNILPVILSLCGCLIYLVILIGLLLLLVHTTFSFVMQFTNYKNELTIQIKSVECVNIVDSVEGDSEDIIRDEYEYYALFKVWCVHYSYERKQKITEDEYKEIKTMLENQEDVYSVISINYNPVEKLYNNLFGKKQTDYLEVVKVKSFFQSD